jgi:radical SAM protein with 4Fe4S-binding SPASM domain
VKTGEEFLPYLVAVNITRRCNLSCDHCYMDALQRNTPGEEELTIREISSLFSQIGERAPGTIVVLTGGEPLMHPEIDQMVRTGVQTGLRMVIGTNGVLLTESRIQHLKSLGLSGVGISLDSVYAKSHDVFRGVPGSFERACKGIRLCRKNDLHVQVHFTVMGDNYRQMEQAVGLAREMGASIINFFFLVCVGRGNHTIDLPPELYEQTLREIARLQEQSRGLMVQARCAPHFKRILYQRHPDSPFTRATGYDGGGCPAATHYCRIDPQGEMTPCPYMELSGGNIREIPFWQIWETSPLFHTFRNPVLQGRCGECEYISLCGGCRARSLAQSGDLMAEDPNCSYIPLGGKEIPVFPHQAAFDQEAQWTDEARARLKKLPLFLRPIIKRNLEARAKAEGISITPELMQKYRQEREKELGIRFE